MNDTPAGALAERTQRLLADADLCVKCGLCLPHCPTYGRGRQEGESPRGRIALAQALASGALAPSAALAAHLQSCLVCRACESVCPSAVPYERIIDGARAELRRLRPAGAGERVLRWGMAEVAPRYPRLAAAAGRTLRRWPWRSLLQGPVGRRLRLARVAPYLQRLQDQAPRWRALYPAHGAERGRVSLFLGCVARHLDRVSLDAAIQVLTRLGYTVEVPTGQACCGAMHLHGGDEAGALRLARANLQVFAGAGALLSVASGCGATIRDYPHLRGLTAAEREAATGLAGRTADISRFLAQAHWPSTLAWRDDPLTVVVHEPCTLRNGLREAQGVYQLLARLPGLAVDPLPGNATCCGAAGTHVLTHPGMADGLREEKLRAIRERPVDVLVTSNIGCALHLEAGLRAQDARTEVLHPISLLARRLLREPVVPDAGLG